MANTATVNISSIIPPRHQPRSEAGDVSDIVGSLNNLGVFFSALPVKRNGEGSYTLIAGERRWRALKKASEADPTIPPLVHIIIYGPEELDAAIEWGIALEENRKRRSLAPVDEARAIKEMKLRLDCRDLRRSLEGKGKWTDEELPQSLEAWQIEYQRLAQLAAEKGRDIRGIITTTWQVFEQDLGISEQQRKQMIRLANASAATQVALQRSGLEMQHQVAITYAPEARQVELTEVVSQTDDVTVVVTYSAAHTLQDERMNDYSTAQIVETALRLYRLRPRQSAKELAAATILEILPRMEDADEEGGLTDNNFAPTSIVNTNIDQAADASDEEIEYDELDEMDIAAISAQLDRGLAMLNLQGGPGRIGGRAFTTKGPPQQ